MDTEAKAKLIEQAIENASSREISLILEFIMGLRAG